MKALDKIGEEIKRAETRITELIKGGDLKKLSDIESHQMHKFFEEKSRHRLETAKIIYQVSTESATEAISKDYKDFAEVVAASYYAMYYIVHSFLALQYQRKLREGIRGVHAITKIMLVYYLVKTGKLARHLYEEYLRAFRATSQIHNIGVEDFQEKAFAYAQQYDKSRTAREIFTYNVTPNVEEYHAKQAIISAEEFISTIRQVMVSK